MKILVAGAWYSELHEKAVYEAFTTLGQEVSAFSWHEYFQPGSDKTCAGWVKRVLKKIQEKFIVGPLLHAINQDFLKHVARVQPDMIFLYRGTHLTPHTLLRVKRMCPTPILIGYNNDDPFAPQHPRWLWRYFRAAIPLYDVMFAYRPHNIEEYQHAGAQRVGLLRSWFLPAQNYPLQLLPEDQQRFGCDVVFAGHYEPDGRQEMLAEIATRGFDLRLFGPEWAQAVKKESILFRFQPIQAVRGAEYNNALNGAKVALCFLSKLNRDTYTRRCFEIPAAGTFLLSEFSEDLATLYQEGVEAEFFRSSQELLSKLSFYLTDSARRQQIAEAGRRRVLRDGHDVVSRMHQVLAWLNEYFPR